MDKQHALLKLLFLIALWVSSQASAAPVALTPDQAFQLDVSFIDDQGFNLDFRLAPDQYLYANKILLKTLTGQTIPENATTLPQITPNHQDNLFENNLSFFISQPSGEGFLIQYQGCASSGYCYTPQARLISRNSTGYIQVASLSLSEFQQAHTRSLTTNDSYQQHLQTRSAPMIVLIFLGIGLLLAFTPCMFPMIPILANLVVGKSPHSSKRGLLLGTLYVLSMAICYGIIGALAGLAGNEFQRTLQQPLPLTIIGIILIVLALDQLEILNLRLPTRQWQGTLRSGSLWGAIGLGILSAFIISPCVTPAFVGALTYIGQTGNALLGGIALFALALGMGLPLLAVVILGRGILPTSGSWLRYTKRFFGLLLLVLASYFFWQAWPKEPHPSDRIYHSSQLQDTLKQAEANQQPAIVMVHADWCSVCLRLNKRLQNDPLIQKELENVTFLKFDVTKQTQDNEQFLDEYAIIGPPTFLFFNSKGQELSYLRMVGDVNNLDFYAQIKSLKQLQESLAKQ